MSYCLGTDSNNFFRIVSQRGNEKPVVRRIEPKMINAPFHIRQRNGSSQNERSCARGRRDLVSTHLYCECRYQCQDRTKTAPFSQSSPPSQIPFSGVPEHQTRHCSAGDEDRLWNFPAKQHGETHRTDQYGR
jgi:hypothetical protein